MALINSIIETFEGIPSTRVNRLEDLQPGDHIKMRRYVMLYAHHAIVKIVNNPPGTFTVVHYMEHERGQCNLVIDEEKIVFADAGKIKKINYEHRLMVNEGLERLPPNVTVAIADYFRENSDAIDPYMALTNNCEHFAFTCTLGFAISFQQLKAFVLILLPLFGLNIIQFVIVLALTSVGVFNVARQRRVLSMRKVVAYYAPTNTCLVFAGSRTGKVNLQEQ